MNLRLMDAGHQPHCVVSPNRRFSLLNLLDFVAARESAIGT
jgi:hypothetical protein